LHFGRSPLTLDHEANHNRVIPRGEGR
jgi:hypothetical protein